MDFCCSCTEAGIVELTPTRQTTQENNVGLDICTGGKVQVVRYKWLQMPSVFLQCQAML